MVDSTQSLEEKIAAYGSQAVFYTELGQTLTRSIVDTWVSISETAKRFFSRTTNQ